MELALLNLLGRSRSIGTWTVESGNSQCLWSPATYAIHEENPEKTIHLAEALDYYVAEHRPIIERCVQEGIERHKSWDVELQIQTAKGNLRWVRAIGEPLYEGDRLVRLHGIFEDIDERKSLETERETLLQRMLEGERMAKLGHWYRDINRHTKEWSPGLYRMFGYPDDQPPPSDQQFLTMVHPEDREVVAGAVREAVSAGSRHKFDFRLMVHLQQKFFHAELFPQKSSDGELMGLMGVFVDQTSDVQSRREIEELNRRHRLALEASKIGVWEWDIQTDALIWDERMYALYGISEGEFSGGFDAWEKGLHPDDRHRIQTQIQEALKRRSTFNEVFRVVLPNQEISTLKGVADLIVDANGEPQRMIGVNWDISEIEAIRSELERSNQELAQFAYRTSHDLKGPLTSIRRLAAYTDQDMDEGKFDEARQNLNRIEHRAGAMETMVLGILDAAKAELTESPSGPLDLGALIKDVVEVLQPVSAENDVAVTWTVNCSHPPYLPHIRVYQILQNLISNGIKYAAPERQHRFVKISAADGANCLALSVEDNGSGIPNADDSQPFEMFRRFHSNVSGSGLGLYIVKKHVESLGGHIQLSTSPAGTRFDLSIPDGRTTQ